jgi:hypothetical protein
MAEYTLATIESENTNVKDWYVSGPIYQELFQSVADWATRLAREDAELRRQNSSLLRALCWLMNEPRSGAAQSFAKRVVCEVNAHHSAGGTGSATPWLDSARAED